VARRLELPVARVRRAEMRGLRSLRRMARTGCAAASTADGAGAEPGLAGTPAADGAAAAAGVLASGSDPESVRGDGDGDGGASGGSDGAGGSAGDGASAGGVKGISAVGSSPRLEDAGTVMPLLGVLLVLVCLAAFGREARRAWRSRA